MRKWQANERPGFAEIGVGIATFEVALVLVALSMGYFASSNPVTQGMIGSFGGGVAGIAGFLAVAWMRRRNLAELGVRPCAPKWLAIAIGVAAIAYVLSGIIVAASTNLRLGSGTDPQAVLHAAAQGGVLSLLVSLLGGAVLTGIGEELLFRGVLANALNKYGALAGVGISSVIFGLAHGTGVVLPVAIMVGLFAAVLLSKTMSIWPCVVLHAVYNGLHIVESAMSGVSP